MTVEKKPFITLDPTQPCVALDTSLGDKRPRRCTLLNHQGTPHVWETLPANVAPSSKTVSIQAGMFVCTDGAGFFTRPATEDEGLFWAEIVRLRQEHEEDLGRMVDATDAIERLTRELEQCRNGFESLNGAHEALRQRFANACAEITRLRGALADYGQHQQKSCLDLPASETKFCYCGLNFAISGECSAAPAQPDMGAGQGADATMAATEPVSRPGSPLARPEGAAEPPPTAQWLAVQFHEIYERLAPSFGYETRRGTRHFDPESPNGRLMIAVCAEILKREPALQVETACSDPQLQDAVEHFLHWSGDLTRCPACHKIRSQGHTANCRINALNAVLNSRVPRVAPRGKPCTCDNCLGSSVPCRVEAGQKLGELWYCRKAAEAQNSAPKASDTRNTFQVRNGPETLPCDHCGHFLHQHSTLARLCPDSPLADGGAP